MSRTTRVHEVLCLLIAAACTPALQREQGGVPVVAVENGMPSSESHREDSRAPNVTSDSGVTEAQSETKRERTDRHGDLLPIECVQSLTIVDYLADLNCYAESYAAERSDPINPERVVEGVSSHGLQVRDVNDRSDQLFKPGDVGSQIEQRRGPVFIRLTHLGHIYCGPPQYSKVSCTVTSGKLTIELSHWYRLTFVQEVNAYKLQLIEYLELEGD